MLKHIPRLPAVMICAVLLGLAIGSCTLRPEPTEVLALWDLEEDDQSADMWNKNLKKELRIHGVHAKIHDFYVPHDRAGSFDISETLDAMEAEGSKAGLIIAGGDMNLHLIYDSGDSRLGQIPAVSFGAFFPTREDRARHTNVGIIKDTVDIVHNLELMRLLWPETRQFVTDIDWTQCAYESELRDMVYNAVEALGDEHLVNNVKIRYNDKQMEQIMGSRPDAMSMTALSLWDPWINISTERKTRIYPQYAFNPATSKNRVLLFKNDKTTRLMTDDESFMAFCTAVPQQFEVCDSCAGGFLAPIDVTMRQVARMAGIMLAGNGEAPFSTIYLSKDYYLDWNVLRGKYKLEDIPGYIHVRNMTLKDRDIATWRAFIALFSLATVALAVLMVYLTSKQSRKSRSIKRAMLSSARESIRIKEEFDFIRKESNIHIWSLSDKLFTCEDPKVRFRREDITSDMFDDFYREKLERFLDISEPGKHQIQLYGTSPISGDRGWMELRMYIKETPSGIERTGVTVDINDLKKAEAQLIETHRRLVNAQERDSFISSISHEMRTPLNTILGFTQILTEPELRTDKEERMLMRNAVVNNGDELTNIINNILALTRIENGAVQMTMEECRVKDMIEDLWSEAEVKAASNNIDLKLTEGPENSVIRADRLIFKIIVQNVLGNAIKFSEPGGEVSVSWIEHADRVAVDVLDHGKGIDKSNQELIFTRFYKIDQFSQGVGLGLSISWEYISRMGGAITLESKPGSGSLFHLIFSKTGKGIKA